MLKKLISLIVITLLVSNSSEAQEDSNCGIIIDDVKADSIPCWSFDHMNIVFPINKDFENYDQIQIRLRIGFDMKNHERYGVDYFIRKDFTKESFQSTFKGGKYGVWKIFRDKNKDYVKSDDALYGGWSRERLAKLEGEDKKLTGWYLQFEISGINKKGTVNGTTMYSDGVYLYKTKMVPANRHKKNKVDPGAQCQVPGEKKELNTEASPAYRDDFGVIK